MLYVFNVNTGAMFTFDMSLAVESVSQLMLHIQETCKIPSDRQVLLISGGEVLPPTARVCSYSAGTDTNPIYLFNLNLIESSHPPPPFIEQGLDIDFNESVKELIDMPATYNTVCQRTTLAQQFYESATELTKTCENIVHEQHMQHQGYAAAVANYQDTISDFRIRTEAFQKRFSDFLDERASYLKLLGTFHADLETLAKIPILPALVNSEGDTKTEENAEESHDSEAAASRKETREPPKTLLEWISAADNKKSMNVMFQHCTDQLEKVYKSLEMVVKNVLVEVTTEERTEIRGLTDRLCGLDKLLHEAKKYVQEQGDLAQSFLQNQARAGNIGDTSILPDLCASHRKQLKVMLDNHNRLIDNRRRCVKAKAELGEAIHRRLKWIVDQEDKVRELNHRMLAFCENLQRVRDFLQIVQQIHRTPAIYLSAVAEVVRRRAFSQVYLSRASELACHLLTIHNEEMTRRKEFHSQFDTHFICSLFPGMDDMPPAFATQAPDSFDNHLPKLTIEDIEQLIKALPQFSDDVKVPDIDSINNLFMVKTFVKSDIDKIDDRGVEEKIQQVVNEVGLANTMDRNLLKPAESDTCLATQGIPHLRDLDRGCESETDTEEFEKVGQSPLELHFEKDISSSPRPRTHDASTLTEDNLQTSRSEHDRLKSIVIKMAMLARQALGQLRSELMEYRALIVADRNTISMQYESLTSSWESLTIEIDNKEREIIHKMTTDHKMEIEDFKRLKESKEKEVMNLQNEVLQLETSLQNSSEEVCLLKKAVHELQDEYETEKKDMEKILESLKLEKQQCVKELGEKLVREHKAEIESIRSRFRLMSITKMEKSPSESNLDGIERGESKELVNHEAIILQLKENYEIEKQKAVSAAILQESRKWESILNEKLGEMKTKHELEKEIILDEAIKKSS
ncbi:hypothetical protein ILUMI_27364 [Ignelater luminosus]|uniref:RB1-inducible coiled-coil protein 1 n=1 Tax=Ignelater luminosus TaxID=2038154 RepID=A0A8K0C6A7_IGNLU|nr:hypothetical protein ILUMI_27364 [Ignelater luminosus]